MTDDTPRPENDPLPVQSDAVQSHEAEPAATIDLRPVPLRVDAVMDRALESPTDPRLFSLPRALESPGYFVFMAQRNLALVEAFSECIGQEVPKAGPRCERLVSDYRALVLRMQVERPEEKDNDEEEDGEA